MGRMVRERVWCATGCSGVDWFPMDILGGRAGGAVVVYTLGGWSVVYTGDCGGARAGSCWAITLGDAGGFTLGADWVFCSGVEYGGGGVLGSKMSRMRVRAYKRSVFSMADTYLMVNDRKWSAWTMQSSDVTVG